MSDLSATAFTCGAAIATGVVTPIAALPDIACGLSVVGSYLTDWELPQEQILAASDPPDPEYMTVVTVPAAVPTAFIQTNHPDFDLLANQLMAALSKSSIYIQALNTSINRYASALAANDASNAILQLEAILHYAALYSDGRHQAGQQLAQLIALAEVSVLAVGLECTPF